MGINIAIGSTSGAVLIIGILLIVFGTVSNYPSLLSLGKTLATLGGIVIGIFILFSIIRNIKSL
jgi:hypothetical protein